MTTRSPFTRLIPAVAAVLLVACSESAPPAADAPAAAPASSAEYPVPPPAPEPETAPAPARKPG
jgi:hypothetical protein